jgi:protein-disulfide isomerase
MFSRMKRLLLACLLVAGCRPADGGSQTTPNSPSKTAASAQNNDSARADSLLSTADAGRIQGAASAPVWLVEISDFQCPFCKRWHDEVYPVIKRDYIDKGIVRMAYVHLPLQQHPNAYPAAIASMCAALQNRFWPMHDKLFATQERWGVMQNPGGYFDSLAVSSGVTSASFRSCVMDPVMRRLISGDIARARTAQVRSTPTFFIGDEPILGVAPIDSFRVVIERQRAKKAKPSS